jgi:hypothetical protein
MHAKVFPNVTKNICWMKESFIPTVERTLFNKCACFFFFLHMLGNFENILNTHPSMMGLYCVLSLWWKQAIPWGDRREQFNNTSASYYGLPPLLPHITYARSYNCFLRKLWVYVLRLVVPFHFHLHKHKSVKRVEERHFPKQQYEYVLFWW